MSPAPSIYNRGSRPLDDEGAKRVATTKSRRFGAGIIYIFAKLCWNQTSKKQKFPLLCLLVLGMKMLGKQLKILPSLSG